MIDHIADGEPDDYMGRYAALVAEFPQTGEFGEIHGLAVVTVDRPADLPAAIGWTSSAFAKQPHEHVHYLRAWEDRFDAVPIAIGERELHLCARRLPAPGDAAKVAQELYLYNSYLISLGEETVEELAEQTVSTPYWRFWWN